MSDKLLSEAEWKKFVKAKDLNDVLMGKALAALDRAERSTPKEQLQALENVQKQILALLKQHKADKEISAHLIDIDKALKKATQIAATAQKQADTKTERPEPSTDEDDASPEALGSRLLPLMRQVIQGHTMQAMIAMVGKDMVVLISRKTIGPTQRKLLGSALTSSSGIKYIAAQCLFEDKAHTFVVASQAAGLAKRIKAALLKQTGQRYKVRVRGEDPSDVDEDLEEDEHAATRTDDPVHVGAAFNARLAALLPRVKTAMATPGPLGQQLKRQVSEAGTLARSKRFDQANARLDELEQLLPPEGDPKRAQGFNTELFQQRWRTARTAWPDALDEINAQINKLQRALQATQNPLGLAMADQGMNALTGRLKVGLQVALMELDQAPPERCEVATRKVRTAAGAMQRFLDTDPVLPLLENNPFGVMLTLRSRLGTALSTIQQACTP